MSIGLSLEKLVLMEWPESLECQYFLKRVSTVEKEAGGS